MSQARPPFDGFLYWNRPPLNAVRPRTLPPEFWPENEDLRLPRETPPEADAEEYLVFRPFF